MTGFAAIFKIVGMEHDNTDHIIAQKIGEILAFAILRQRQRSENNSVDFPDARSVYDRKGD